MSRGPGSVIPYDFHPKRYSSDGLVIGNYLEPVLASFGDRHGTDVDCDGSDTSFDPTIFGDVCGNSTIRQDESDPQGVFLVRLKGDGNEEEQAVLLRSEGNNGALYFFTRDLTADAEDA